MPRQVTTTLLEPPYSNISKMRLVVMVLQENIAVCALSERCSVLAKFRIRNPRPKVGRTTVIVQHLFAVQPVFHMAVFGYDSRLIPSARFIQFLFLGAI